MQKSEVAAYKYDWLPAGVVECEGMHFSIWTCSCSRAFYPKPIIEISIKFYNATLSNSLSCVNVAPCASTMPITKDLEATKWRHTR